MDGAGPWTPGHRPTQDAAWPAVGKRVMSQPSPAAITPAVRRAGRLRRRLRWASSASSSGAPSLAMSAFSIARAHTASTLVTMLPSLVFAVSRTFRTRFVSRAPLLD